MRKKINVEELFKKDIEPLVQNTLDYSQLKDRITINENVTYDNKYHTHNPNRRYIDNRLKLASVILSIILVVSLSLILLKGDKKEKYNSSPFNDQLHGVVFGDKAINVSTKNKNVSNFIDLQNDDYEPIYFYETNLKELDNYYTCAYYPTKYIAKIKEEINEISFDLRFAKSLDIIDGKFIYGYKKFIDNTNSEIKWYQFERDINKVPLTINDYSLGLILESRDIYFSENKTLREKINFTKKIFIRNYYNYKTKEFDNSLNINSFITKLNDRNLILSDSIIRDTYIEEINFYYHFKLNNDGIILKSKLFNNIDFLGHYKEQLNELLISKYEIDGEIYGIYDYDRFSEKFLKLDNNY